MIISSILKKCLKGVLYIFTLPFLLIVLSIYGTIGVLIFIFIGLKGLFYFFTGRNLFGDFPEDVRAKEIMSGTAVTSVEINNAQNNEIHTIQENQINNNEDIYITQPDDTNTTVVESYNEPNEVEIDNELEDDTHE